MISATVSFLPFPIESIEDDFFTICITALEGFTTLDCPLSLITVTSVYYFRGADSELDEESEELDELDDLSFYGSSSIFFSSVIGIFSIDLIFFWSRDQLDCSEK